jgi:DNA-binding HxlR family transcriptional regulator
MGEKRSYGQYCTVARALDVVGERWTLLLVRELSTGPKRFKDLLEGLPGIGTNLLASRLKSLEEQGIICRDTLPPPAGSNVYELTELGGSLEPVIVALSRWGARLLDVPREGENLRAGWAAVAMRSVLGAGSAGGRPGTYEFRIDGEVFHLRVGEEGESRDPTGCSPGPGPGRHGRSGDLPRGHLGAAWPGGGHGFGVATSRGRPGGPARISQEQKLIADG